MLMSRDQNAGQDSDVEITDRSFENVSPFQYLGTAVTDEMGIYIMLK
jgi:hypothetical protein